MDIVEVKRIYKNVNDQLGNVVAFHENIGIGFGDTISMDSILSDVFVGVSVESNDVSDYDFMAGLVSIYHENRHVEQLQLIHNCLDRYLEL